MNKNRPLPTAELDNLPSIPPSEDPPERFTSSTGGNLQFSLPEGETPHIETQTLGNGAGRVLWRANVQGHATLGWPGRRIHAITKPTKRPDASLDGHGPPWMNLRYRPKWRPLTPMKRTPQGRLVRPLEGFHLLEDDSYPWSCVGLINTSDNFNGTGSLVGSRLVLTASHVVPWNSINSGNGWSMTFTPNYRSVGLNHQPFGLSYVSDVLYYREVGEPPAQHDSFAAAEDYAVLRLYDPLGDQLGYFGNTDYSEDWNNLAVWANVGYTDGDGPFAQTEQTIVDGDSPGIFGGPGLNLETYAELFPGMSGGPFWAWFNTSQGSLTPRITGVVGGTADGDEKLLAGGGEMVALVEEARTRWT
jgi:Trypsin-like peptidase domain